MEDITITVTGVNDVLIAGDDSGVGFTTEEQDSFITASVLDNDTDKDTSDILSVERFNTTGTIGLVTYNNDGTFSYNPNVQFRTLKDRETAIDMFTYVVSDGNGGIDTATVTITINGITGSGSGRPGGDGGQSGGVAPLTLEGTPILGGQLLSKDELLPIVDAAINYWSDLGINNGQLQQLENTDILIKNLGGTLLGSTNGSTITLDDDAAGYG